MNKLLIENTNIYTYIHIYIYICILGQRNYILGPRNLNANNKGKEKSIEIVFLNIID